MSPPPRFTSALVTPSSPRLAAGMRARAAALSLCYGFLLGWIWSALTLRKAAAVWCTCKNISTCEKECNITEESSHFSCSGREQPGNGIDYQCAWSLTQYRTYHLYTKQERCKVRQLQNHSLTSKPFILVIEKNVTAYALAVSEDKKRCTIAKFTGSPSQMILCGPPRNVSFTRRHGRLTVSAEWGEKRIVQYYVKYREHNSTLWKEVRSENSRDCTVENLTSLQSYEMQIQCVVSTECPQCPLSEVISVPQEFVEASIITEMKESLIKPGQRKVIVEWEHVQSEAVDSYNITVQKESGEVAEVSSYSLHTPVISLILCDSAYNISISALNRAGSSPSAHQVIKAMDHQINSNFTVQLNNNSFRLSWSNNLTVNYSCYAVEWWQTGHRSAYQSFYERKNRHKVDTQNDFQPYEKYHFFLHARPDKDTCNLKNVNNSELTIGRAEVYLTEGAPLAAPWNISISNVTQSSFVLTWKPVAEKDLRGFLQGYIIHYINATDNSEKNVTVDAAVTSYELVGLQSQTVYQVRMSAYTAAGEGRPSDVLKATTDAVAISGMLAGVIVGIIVLLLAFHLCFRLLQRSKSLLWPSIPNPYNSKAVQKIEGGHELEMLKPLCRQDYEETEERVCVLEAKKEASSSSSLILHNCRTATSFPMMREDNQMHQSSSSSIDDSTTTAVFSTESNKNDSEVITPIHTNTLDSTANNTANNSTPTDRLSTSVSKPAMVYVNDYTTMELFQQIAGAQNPPSQTGSSGTAPSNPGQDYIRQALIYAEPSQQERGFQ